MVVDQPITSLRQRWQDLSLVSQFMAIGLTVLTLGMAAIGTWIGYKIEQGYTRNTASVTALYVDSVVAPMVQELADKRTLSADSIAALDAVFSNTILQRRIPSVKIWTSDGHIVYATLNDLIGIQFEVSAALKSAWSGRISTELDDLSHTESTYERATGIPLLEVYSPIRDSRSGKIIAVVEFYASAQQMTRNLLKIQFQSWGVVGLITLVMIGLLFRIVQRGSRTIEAQRLALQKQIQDLSSLLRQNTALRQRVEDSSERAAESNERFLRAISAELHDGPAQNLSFSMLRLDSLKPYIKTSKKQKINPLDYVEIIRNSITEALQEIRFLSSGLALPELKEKNLKESIYYAIKSHERRTDTQTITEIGELPKNVKLSIKICLYRFIQEALNNAFVHADGVGQAVKVFLNDGYLVVQVSDKGPGLLASDRSTQGTGLGLLGIKERIECLHGKFKIVTSPQKGTLLEARFSIDILSIPKMVDEDHA